MPNLSNPVTFLFAGDGSLSSDGLSAFLQTKSNLLLIAECHDGATAVADIKTHTPDIAVIDAQLADMDARQIIAAVRASNYHTRIIVLGASPERCVADELLASGADAYIVRSGPSRHLNEAIRYVQDGGKYLAPQLTREKPVSLNGNSKATHCEAESRLHAALEAQTLTVAKLEQAMGRAQNAIEVLQQRVEKLTVAAAEPPPGKVVADVPKDVPKDVKRDAPWDVPRQTARPGIRNILSGAAAALIVAVLGFQLAGTLRPAAAHSTDAQSSVSAVTPSPFGQPEWESENIETARTHLQNQQYAAAEKLCRMVLKQDPQNTDAARILASSLFHQGRISESADVVQSIAVPPIHRR